MTSPLRLCANRDKAIASVVQNKRPLHPNKEFLHIRQGKESLHICCQHGFSPHITLLTNAIPSDQKRKKITQFLSISRVFSLSIGFFGKNSSLTISYPLLGCGRHNTSLHIWPRYFSTYRDWRPCSSGAPLRLGGSEIIVREPGGSITQSPCAVRAC